MIIVCSKSELSKSINIAMRAVSARTTLPILECILINATEPQIHFVANDMDLGVETIVEGTIYEKGMIALDAKIFSEIVRRLPDEDVTIRSADEKTAIISCGKAKFSIPSQPGDEFIFLPTTDSENGLAISQLMFREMIRQTIFSIAINENNAMMMGELLEIRDGLLRLISLDGHRIAIRNHKLSIPYPNTKVIIPGKTLQELQKILSSEMEDIVVLYFEQNQIVFRMNKSVMISRLIDGDYFRVDQMMPKDSETTVVLNKKEFLECIDRSSLLIREGDKKPLILDIKDDSIELSIVSTMGSMNEEIEIRKEGANMKIAFNPKLLMDALRVISEDEVTIKFSNPKAPCVIRDEAQTYMYLILPVNY